MIMWPFKKKSKKEKVEEFRVEIEMLIQKIYGKFQEMSIETGSANAVSAHLSVIGELIGYFNQEDRNDVVYMVLNMIQNRRGVQPLKIVGMNFPKHDDKEATSYIG